MSRPSQPRHGGTAHGQLDPPPVSGVYWSHWPTLFRGSEAPHDKVETCGVRTTTTRSLPLRDGDVRLDLPPSFAGDYRKGRKTAGGSEKQC